MRIQPIIATPRRRGGAPTRQRLRSEAGPSLQYRPACAPAGWSAETQVVRLAGPNKVAQPELKALGVTPNCACSAANSGVQYSISQMTAAIVPGRGGGGGAGREQTARAF